MLAGIPFHVALIYAAGTDWFISSPDKSHLLGGLAGISNGLRMPLFFWIAGTLSYIVLSRSDTSAWVRKRVVRLGIPLLTSTLVISPLVIAAMALDNVQANGTGFLENWWELLSRAGGHWVGHLWFLQVLIGCSILVSLFHPMIRRLADFQLTLTRLILLSLFVSLWRFFLNGAIYFLSNEFGYDGLLHGLIKLEAFIEFAPYFAIGFVFAGRSIPRLHTNGPVWLLLIICGVSYAMFWNQPEHAAKFVRYFCVGPLSIIGSGMILSFAQERILKGSRHIDFLIKSSYNVYLFHYPVLLFLGVLFIGVDLPIAVEFSLIVCVTYGICFLLDFFIRRNGTLSYLFNGIATRRPSRRDIRSDPVGSADDLSPRTLQR